MEIYYVIVLSLIFSALFSGIEIAYVSANKLKIELQGKRGKYTGKILQWFNKLPSYFIGTMLIGNNIALVVFGIALAQLVEPPLNEFFYGNAEATGILTLITQTLFSTLIVLLVGEFFPKVIFRLNPNGILNFFAIPLSILFVILSPFVAVIILISKIILRYILGIKVEESKPVFSKVDLEHFVKETKPNQDDENEINTELFENALYLIKVKVRECMVPRPEIKGVDIESSIEELKQEFIETKLSRILIYNEDIDNILGYVHHHDLLKAPKDIKSVMFTLPVIPETMPAMDVLNLFTNERKNIAWVVDEYGGTAGIVTLEDILEEIFGEIQDEHDKETFVEKQISDNEYIFSGRMEVDYLNETYDLDLPEGDYETLSGLIVSEHESIPRMDEKIYLDNFEFTILYVSETKIETVKLRILNKE